MSDQLSADLASLKIDRDKNPNRRHPIRWVLIGGGVIAALVIGYLALIPFLESKLFKTEVGVTQISLVSPAHASIQLTSTGYVVPDTVSKVSAKVPGKVIRVDIKQGDRVAQGDVLMEIDATDQKAAIASSRARVAAARAQAETSRANLAEARMQAERARRLADQGVGPAAAAQDAEARVSSLQAAVKAADAQVRAAQAEVDALEINLDSYTVMAPIAGVVLSKPPQLGEIVGPTMGGIATEVGTIEIADFSTLVVETDVPEQRLHLVNIGGPCEITLDAFPQKRYRGKALEITPRVNRAKATATVKVAFADDTEGALPDMSARVSFLEAELDPNAIKEPPKLVVPGSALADRDGARVVFVVDGDRVRMTPVKVGEPFGSGFVLLAGPGAGTRVVKEPPSDLSDGQQVKERTDG